MSERIRVLLVDDDPLVRTGLAMVLGGAPDLEVVGEAGDGSEALRCLDATPVDVVLMDIRMPVMDGLTATERILQRPSTPHIIVLTTFDTDDHVVRALAAGASGFLLKDTPPPRIVDAVRTVAAGDPILSPSVTGQLIRHVASNGTTAAERAAVEALTEREREVALAVARGASNADIAKELFMSVATVKVHLGHVFAKLGVSNRVQVAIRMHDAGLS
ncbi:response regulator transcription factor [Aeromicrobium sp. YIM 150415]|uniref:response regulator n=1 Tax=Aeromicrobium sp. YIM 150415 TaxID=2803912 RepID=UPI001962E9C7|nr:response regulator transcription factor [Aeromicrobium sp. YIM 150415]MBM9462749.1 response regulator transcription factor [Aeromicrobium sp. YIM 150415]